METKAIIVIMSHLSDVQELIHFGRTRENMDEITNSINFAKWLMMKYQKDLTVEIDPDHEYNLFTYRQINSFLEQISNLKM